MVKLNASVRAALIALVPCVLLTLLSACSAKIPEGHFSCATGPCPMDWYCSDVNARCYSSQQAASNAGDGDAGDGDGDITGEGDGDGDVTGGDGDGDGDVTGGDGDGDAGGAGGESGSSAGHGGDSGSSAGEGGASGVSAGTSGTGDLDSGMPPAPTYEACTEDSASCDCQLGPDPDATSGSCGKPCSQNSDCPPASGTNAKCVMGECLPDCTSPSDCAGDLGCYIFPLGMGSDVHACFEVQSAQTSGSVSCTPMGTDCPPPGACIFHPIGMGMRGVCSLRCDINGATQCPTGTRCIQAIEDATHCFKECSGPTDCGADLVCAPFGAGSDVCIPTAWQGHAPPFTMPMMM